MSSLLAPEHRLVLLTAGGLRNEPALRRLLDGRLDWERVGAIARRERAWPVIWRQLDQLRAPNVPDHLSVGLRRLAMVYDFRLAHLESRLWDTVAAFERQGIEAMLLKGAALAVSVYPSFLERPMGDLDLLVRADSGEKAWRVAQEVGWSWPANEFPLQTYESHRHWPPLVDPNEAGACLEIHTDPFAARHPFRFPVDALWRVAVPYSAHHPALLVPAPPHLLLHTCIHFAWSHRMGLGAWRTFRDVWALIDADVIDWTAFVKLARQARAGSCAYWTLRLAHLLANAPVPTEVISALRPPGSAFSHDRVERHFALSLFPAERVCPSFLSKAIWEWGIRPDSCGHGSIRPWAEKRRQPHGVQSAVRHVRGWRLWLHYVRGLVFPATVRS